MQIDAKAQLNHDAKSVFLKLGFQPANEIEHAILAELLKTGFGVSLSPSHEGNLLSVCGSIVPAPAVEPSLEEQRDLANGQFHAARAAIVRLTDAIVDRDKKAAEEAAAAKLAAEADAKRDAIANSPRLVIERAAQILAEKLHAASMENLVTGTEIDPDAPPADPGSEGA